MAANQPNTDPEQDDLQRQYYRHIPRAELQQRSAESLRGAVQSHLDLAGERPQGTSKVRAWLPTTERDGWDADGHMVVEIVTEDRPFLVDSVMSFLLQEGFGIDRVIHPQLLVRRDITGVLRAVEPEGTQGNDVVRESWMHLELDVSSDPDAFSTIEDGLESILRDVQDVVDDWPKMQEQALGMIDQLRKDPPPVPEAEIAEAAELLSWLTDGHFTFMGYREYELTGGAGEEELKIVPATGLGIMRGDQRVSGAFSALPADVRAKARTKTLLIVSKANSRSTVHRSVYLDYIGFKTFDASGEVTGERRFLGLFTSAAYTESVARIPILGRKADAIMDRLGYEPDSHNGKAVVDLLETYPRDELFQMSVEDLAPIADDLLQLRERRQLRLFLRRDDYGRFLSCLVYLPRDRYTTDVRRRIEKILASAIGGKPTIDYTVWVTDMQLARVHLVVRPERGQSVGALDEGALEQRVVDATRSWADDFGRAIDDILGEAATTETMREYASAFPEAYKEDFGARTAVADLRRIETLDPEDAGDLALDFAPAPEGEPGRGQFKIFRRGAPLELTQVLPFFSALGVDVVDERPYHINRTSGPAWVYDFGLRYRGEIDEHSIELFKDAFLACWRGAAEADGFNRLVLGGGLTWRQVVIVRAYAKYLRQAGTPFSQDYIESCLLENVPIVKQLLALFEARFVPGRDDDLAHRSEQADKIENGLMTSLDEVTSLDSDRILRSYLTMIRATSRTNYYQSGADGRPKAYVSFKL
ncbi:MAG: NAD-glutamate dehydrogenase domain-containing protein, partial [Nocardioidaceae bacterium]